MLTNDQLIYRDSPYQIDRTYYVHKTSAKMLKIQPLNPVTYFIRMHFRGAK